MASDRERRIEEAAEAARVWAESVHGRDAEVIAARLRAENGRLREVMCWCPPDDDPPHPRGSPVCSAQPSPPPPDYVLGQELTQQECADALRGLDGVFQFASIHGWTTPNPKIVRLVEWLRSRSLPLEAASEGVRSCLWHADCAAADRALRDGVSPSHPPWPTPAAQTTPSPGTGQRAPDGGCTCHFCAAPPPDAGHNEGEG